MRPTQLSRASILCGVLRRQNRYKKRKTYVNVSSGVPL